MNQIDMPENFSTHFVDVSLILELTYSQYSYGSINQQVRTRSGYIQGTYPNPPLEFLEIRNSNETKEKKKKEEKKEGGYVTVDLFDYCVYTYLQHK